MALDLRDIGTRFIREMPVFPNMQFFKLTPDSLYSTFYKKARLIFQNENQF